MDTNTSTQTKLKKPRFIIQSIEKSNPPKGMPDGSWYRYIVGQDGSKITGYKKGSLRSVTKHVEDFIENLNERSAKGYSPSAPNAGNRKKN